MSQNKTPDDDWQEAWSNPDKMDAAKKRALLEGIHQRMGEGRGAAPVSGGGIGPGSGRGAALGSGGGKVLGMSRRTSRLILIGLGSVAAAMIILFIRFGAIAPIPESKWRELASAETSRKITLADSSVIWLAPHSVVRVYPDFSGHRTTALVRGIAFFSVAKDEQHQFSVSVNQQQVAVLGTSFRLRKLDSVDIHLMVKEGKVALSNPGGRQLLTAGQQVSTAKAMTGLVGSIDPSETDWWLQEQVRWHNVALKDLLSRLEDYYQIKLTHGAIDENMKVSLTWDMTISMEK
ncbi:MAG TPA: FecR domain-containing protein, partial [Puia sp.]|nr:FecR domain-containing protein [Puia sp.]